MFSFGPTCVRRYCDKHGDSASSYCSTPLLFFHIDDTFTMLNTLAALCTTRNGVMRGCALVGLFGDVAATVKGRDSCIAVVPLVQVVLSLFRQCVRQPYGRNDRFGRWRCRVIELPFSV